MEHDDPNSLQSREPGGRGVGTHTGYVEIHGFTLPREVDNKTKEIFWVFTGFFQLLFDRWYYFVAVRTAQSIWDFHFSSCIMIDDNGCKSWYPTERNSSDELTETISHGQYWRNELQSYHLIASHKGEGEGDKGA